MPDHSTSNRPAPRKRPSVKDQRRTRVVGQVPHVSRSHRSSAVSGGGRTRPGAVSGGKRAAVTGGGALAGIDRRFIIGGAIVLAVVVAVMLVFALGGRSGASDSPEDVPVEQSAGEQQVVKNPNPFSVSFASIGDLIFWREVADYIDLYGGASAMANIDDYLSAADVTIANVESPLSDDDSQPIADKDVYIIGRPSGIESITNSGIDLASLANNHIMDYTAPALADTIGALDEAGIKHAGAGMTEDAASEMAELEANGVSIAFFSWTDIIPNNFLAFGDNPGVVTARLNMADACKRVSEAKQTHDIVIVAMHWGIEYEDYITEYLQQDPAHQLVDAGADVILGNHPHVLQGIEFYNGSLIAYAHGNCVFRQAHEFGNTHESYLLNFDITERGIGNVVATPLYLSDDYGIPDFATGDQARSTLARLEEISAGMNTAFDIRDDKAYLAPLSDSGGDAR